MEKQQPGGRPVELAKELGEETATCEHEIIEVERGSEDEVLRVHVGSGEAVATGVPVLHLFESPRM